jgi:hypothetical protein
VAVTEAPETFDPDLSTTVPEKLPVPWPYMGGEIAEPLAIKMKRREALCTKLEAGRPRCITEVAPTIGQFMCRLL